METPPDTIKGELLKHRSAINELKQAYGQPGAYNLTAAPSGMEVDSPLETPVAQVAPAQRAGVRFAPVPEDTPLGGADTPAPKSGRQLVQEVLLFTNPILSGAVAAAGTALIAGVHYLLSASPLTLLTAICYFLLADIAVNFVRSLVSRKWQESGYWAGSAAARAVADRLVGAVEGAAAAHDAFLSARDPVLTLKVAAGLWGLAVLGSYLSFWNVVTLGFLLAFTLPLGYQKYRPAISATTARVSSVAKTKWDGLGLSRKQKAAVLSLLLVMLWVRSSWSTRLVALLVGALAVRCHLKPAEVERITAYAEPYTQSVKKSARRLSLAATDFAWRSLGTKTHVR